jgi:hypothetical protein
MTLSSLLASIASERGKGMTEQAIRNLGKGAMNALLHLMELGMVHRVEVWNRNEWIFVASVERGRYVG